METEPKFLRDARKEKRITQQDLADTVGMSQVSIHHLENGHRRPHPATKKALEKALGVQLKFEKIEPDMASIIQNEQIINRMYIPFLHSTVSHEMKTTLIKYVMDSAPTKKEQMDVCENIIQFIFRLKQAINKK
ncbi:MAG: helix-turn-helix domain-containing protein [Bacteroidota bacterium]